MAAGARWKGEKVMDDFVWSMIMFALGGCFGGFVMLAVLVWFTLDTNKKTD